MIRFLALLLFGGAAVLFMLWTFFKFFAGLQGTKGKMRRDAKLLRESLDNQLDTLSPWSTDELELLSTEHTITESYKGINQSFQGTINNIYHEPVITYGFKRYFSEEVKEVIVAKTSDDDYSYVLGDLKTDLTLNGKPIGTIDNTGTLKSVDGSKVLATLDIGRNINLLPITIGNQEVAGMNNLRADHQIHNRAIKLLEDINPEQEKLVLALYILEFIKYNTEV